jgi:piezo-type mechanosensitive ion channel component 1/2
LQIPTDPESDDLVDELIIISDKTGPESLAWLTGYGVIGLYLSVVLLAGRYTRAIFQYDGAYIMFHEYPNVDELLQLCSGKKSTPRKIYNFADIYLVRELKEWKLEEDLMAKLIYLYRSPETMLRVTKLRPYKPKLKQIKQD